MSVAYITEKQCKACTAYQIKIIPDKIKIILIYQI